MVRKPEISDLCLGIEEKGSCRCLEKDSKEHGPESVIDNRNVSYEHADELES